MSNMDVIENDLEERKRFISECLKLEIELKRLEKEWQMKNKRNLKVKQNNKVLKNKLVKLGKRQLKDEHWQMIKVKECRVVLESVGNRKEMKIETSNQKTNGIFHCQYPGCQRKFTNRSRFYLHMNVHNKRFQCQVCSRCCESFLHLQIHLVVHSGERPFVCNWVGCKKQFKEKQILEEHIIYKHSDKRPFKCKEIGCSKGFAMKRHLKQHLKQHFIHSSNRPFHCQEKECDKQFKTKSTLISHVKFVHGKVKKNFQCQQPGCGKKFTTNWLLNTHINIHAKRYQCQVCQKCFDSSNNLQLHLRIHTGERPFVCDWDGCGCKFQQEGSLKRHIRSRHSNERPFKCNHLNGCDKSYKDKKTLEYHIQSVHSTLRPFQCQVKKCDKRFKTKINLAHHLKNFHYKVAKLFYCQNLKCGKKFTSQVAFNQHLNVHAKKFQCQVCQRCFTSPKNLQTHLRVHTGERPFVCDWNGCGKQFKQKSVLNSHVKLLHSDEKPFICDRIGCGKSFKLKNQLRRHLIFVHLKKSNLFKFDSI